MTEQMPVSIRLSKNEQESIRVQGTKINKTLINMGKQPMRDSDLVHEVLKYIGKLEVDKSGNIYIEE